MAVPSPSSKIALRRRALAARRAYAASLDPGLREELEAKLTAIVLPHLIEARIVAAYYPMREEVSPLRLVDALPAGQRAALPWFAARDARMMFREASAVEAGPWHVLQPPASAEALAPDVVLVPLVFADRRGTRIGHGKGHYDRALAYLRAARPLFAVGIGWETQVCDHDLPADPWDVPLDAIATPREWIGCR